MNVLERLKKFLYNTSDGENTHEFHTAAQNDKASIYHHYMLMKPAEKKLQRALNQLMVFFIYIMT